MTANLSTLVTVGVALGVSLVLGVRLNWWWITAMLRHVGLRLSFGFMKYGFTMPYFPYQEIKITQFLKSWNPMPANNCFEHETVWRIVGCPCNGKDCSVGVFWLGVCICIGEAPGTVGCSLDSQSPAGQQTAGHAECPDPLNPLEVQGHHLHRETISIVLQHYTTKTAF